MKYILLAALLVVVSCGVKVKNNPEITLGEIVCNPLGEYAIKVGDNYLRVVANPNIVWVNEALLRILTDTITDKIGWEWKTKNHDTAVMVLKYWNEYAVPQKIRQIKEDSILHITLVSVRRHQDSINNLRRQYKSCK